MTFTPIQTAFGGVLLHLSTSTLLADTGRVLGISGIIDEAIFGSGNRWTWAVISGLLAGPVVSSITGLTALYPSGGSESLAAVGMRRIILAGGLVGFGARLGSGCTSGHMLCGVSRLSIRSIVATAVFFTSAVITATFAPPPFANSPSGTPTPSIRPIILGLSAVVGVAGLCSSLLRRYNRTHSRSSLRLTPYFLSGLLFSLGLQVSGMSDPRKVWGFLRLAYPSDFDPSLAMIILSGVIPNAVHYALLTRGGTEVKPTYVWESWRIPSRRDVNWRLVFGALTFGIGWGLVGICPGPAVVNLANSLFGGSHHNNSGFKQIVTFVSAMIAGMGVGRRI